MKNLYILLLVIIFSSASNAQTRSLNRFINHYKVQDNALAISIPGWMLDIVAFSADIIDNQDDDIKEILRLSNKISKIRMLIIEEGANIKSKDVNKLISGLKKDHYEELITIHSKDANVKLLVKERRNSIRSITAFVQSEDSLILVTLSGKFKLEDLKNLKVWDQIKKESPKVTEEVI